MSASKVWTRFLKNTESFLKANPDYLSALFKYFYTSIFLLFSTDDCSFRRTVGNKFSSPPHAVLNSKSIWRCIKGTSEEDISRYNLQHVWFTATKRFCLRHRNYRSKWTDGKTLRYGGQGTKLSQNIKREKWNCSLYSSCNRYAFSQRQPSCRVFNISSSVKFCL
jgi:hypothetical protein